MKHIVRYCNYHYLNVYSGITKTEYTEEKNIENCSNIKYKHYYLFPKDSATIRKLECSSFKQRRAEEIEIFYYIS